MDLPTGRDNRAETRRAAVLARPGKAARRTRESAWTSWRGLSVLQSAYALCVISAGVIVGSALAGPAISRFGPRRVMIIGALVIAANFFVLAGSHNGIWHFVVWDAVWGLAFGFVYSAANAAYLEDATPPEAAMYVSANTVVSAAVSGIAPAIFIALLTSRTIPHIPIPDPVVFTQMWIYAGVAAVVMAAIALLVRRPRYVPSTEPAVAMEMAGDIEAVPPGPATA